MSRRSNRHGFKAIFLTTGLICLPVPAMAADKHVEPDLPANGWRILAACPNQGDIFEGISPEVDWAGFKDRDLVILKLTDTDAQIIYKSVWGMRGMRFSENNSAPLHQSSDCGAEDKYVLIGKDGGVKRRWSGPLNVGDLFQTIDAMPMRQYEMRTRSRN